MCRCVAPLIDGQKIKTEGRGMPPKLIIFPAYVHHTSSYSYEYLQCSHALSTRNATPVETENYSTALEAATTPRLAKLNFFISIKRLSSLSVSVWVPVPVAASVWVAYSLTLSSPSPKSLVFLRSLRVCVARWVHMSLSLSFWGPAEMKREQREQLAS